MTKHSPFWHFETGPDIFGQPLVIVADELRSYVTVMKIAGNADRQETERWLNNWAENPHPLPSGSLFASHEKGPFRRRERAMSCLLRLQCLQVCAAIRFLFHNYFNQGHHLYS